MEEVSKTGNNVIKGRQVVWLLLDSFRTSDNSEQIYGFDHLSRLELKNHNLFEFLIAWNNILDNMGGCRLNGSQLRDVFYRKVKDERELLYDINLYDRMPEGRNKRYEYLIDCVSSAIRVQDQKQNFADRVDVEQ